MAYLAAVMAHPAFTARFEADLVRPGLRVPLTADAKLFAEAVALGREVIWLHCYGERFADPAAEPAEEAAAPAERAARRTFRPAARSRPRPSPCPTRWTTTPATRRLKIGKGYVENVTPEMWAYEVSGKQVLWQWFSYRRRDRSRPIIGDRRPPSPLDQDPAGPLAAGIHQRPARPAARARPADRAGTQAGRPAGVASARAGCEAPRSFARPARSRTRDEKAAAPKGKSKSKA